MSRKTLLLFFLIPCLFFSSLSIESKQLPNLDAKAIKEKLEEIMKAHVTYKQINPVIIKRGLVNFIEELDPNKTYFIESDIVQWIEPTEEFLNQTQNEYQNASLRAFEEIQELMVKAIERRQELEKKIDFANLPKNVLPEQFKNLKWAVNEEELLNRLREIKSLQIDAASKLNGDLKEKTLQRIAKRQAKYEEDLLSTDSVQKHRLVVSNTLKALASALDTHTAYFTPAEANQFMINVQQRLFGIGAQLRDDLNGFSVTKIIEGGPASRSELKMKDRIIAVNNEPVVGMDIEDAVELIRGEENTTVSLTVIREALDSKGKVTEESKVEVPILRGEVVLTETRYDSSYEPFGDGVIAYLRLYSFYQDPENNSSSIDLAKAFKKIKQEHNIKGVVLDLRYNTGGLLSQAVSVAGLFITKGIVVSIKDENGNIQHLRDLDGKTIWDGPLVILVNRGSASASEIVAQSLQDYGRALVVGDEHTYGKGSFQTFTLNTNKKGENPEGEYKVTRGKYYTVSGKSPQLTGVISDIAVPGPLLDEEIGEKYAKYPLENDNIKENFEDDLDDVPPNQREKVASAYKFNLQPKLALYEKYIVNLKKNSSGRIENNKNYQNFLKEIKKKNYIGDDVEQFGQNDLQLTEAYNIMKDVIILMMQN